MDFLAPGAFIGSLVAIPIILMYMLRLRRREVSISSTFLWQQVIQDTEANTPWQRLRRNLLLILQLIILLLMVLALARPFVLVDAVGGGQVTVLLDASASMNATDADGRTRFEAAQDEADSIIDSLPDNAQMTVIRVAEVPEILIASTDDKLSLRQAVDDATPSLASGDWDAALNLAASASSNAEDSTIAILSDGGLPDTVGLQGIASDVRYIPVGTSAQNVAITALSTDSLPGEAPQLYARITNYSPDTTAEITFTLRVDGERLESTNLSIPPTGEQPIVSSALPEGFERIEASITQRVSSTLEDVLPVDDVAYAVASDTGTRRVLLVTEGNRFIEQMFGTLPGLQVVRAAPGSVLPDDFDLYLLDQVVPDPLPDGDLWFFNPQEDSDLFRLGGFVEEPENVEIVNPADPRVRYIDTFISFLRVRQVSGTDWGTPLLTVDDVPFLIAGEQDARQIALMPFSLSESDLPLTINWAIIAAFMTDWFSPRTVINVENSLNVGDTLTISPPFDADSVDITLPDGEIVTQPIDSGAIIFAETDNPGFYTLELFNGETRLIQQAFAVNLFSPLESTIAPIPEEMLTIQGQSVNIVAEVEQGQRELWPLVAVAALVILLIEWYAYHQRLRTPTVFRPLGRQKVGV